MDTAHAPDAYENFLQVVKSRHTCRNFKKDLFPEEYIEKILEAARWAQSGANSQPWSFIVVRSPEIRKRLFEAYVNINMDFVYWMEQQRRFELRHPGYKVACDDPAEGLRIKQSRHLWRDAPVIIAMVGDGRKQWGTVLGAHTFSLDQSHLSDGMANASTLVHLAAASLGLSSQWVSIHLQEPFKQILQIPEPLMIHTLIPIGYPETSPQKGSRDSLESLIHNDQFDSGRYLSNRQIIERLEQLRNKTSNTYTAMIK